jgi:signal transduction histidine kinase/DNA-binding NarL/FixJ family response regulator
MAFLCGGGLMYLTGVVLYEGAFWTPLVLSLLLWALSALFVLLLSFWLAELTVPLFLCCCLFDVALTVVTLTDSNPRDMYLWFVCIPVLMLYARGVSSCLVASLLVSAQTAVLRYVAEVMTPFPTAPGFRHSLVGAALSDLWLLSLIVMFSAGNHYARTHAFKRLRAALEDRERANTKLREATKAKTDFLANMSHELRTPMHGIIAMSRELQDMLPPHTKGSHAVAIISDCADHLLSLVNDILDFERIESNQLELEQIPFSIVCETRKVVNMVRFPAEKKQLTLKTNISVTHAQRIGDPVRFRQILFNLLSNAVKFTPEHGSVLVGLTNDPASSEVINLTVSDTGIGIAKENLPRLFSCFSQVDASVNRRYGGSGLGLAISKRLCDAMGGTISCTSEIGKGSTFTVRVSLAEVKESEEQREKSERCRDDLDNVPDKEDAAKLHFNGLEVLLVEDNVVNQKVGKRMLHTLGCKVTVVENGVECLKSLEEKEYGVVLMDCQMPIMDGFQATQRIRELEKSRQEQQAVPTKAPMPIIALTASATKEYGLKCLEVGMSDVLFKPLKREALATALKKWTNSAVVTPPAPATAQQPSASGGPSPTARPCPSCGPISSALAECPNTTAPAPRQQTASSAVVGVTSLSAPSSPVWGMTRGRSCSLPSTLRGVLDAATGPGRTLLFGRKEST